MSPWCRAHLDRFKLMDARLPWRLLTRPFRIPPLTDSRVPNVSSPLLDGAQGPTQVDSSPNAASSLAAMGSTVGVFSPQTVDPHTAASPSRGILSPHAPTRVDPNPSATGLLEVTGSTPIVFSPRTAGQNIATCPRGGIFNPGATSPIPTL